VSLHTDGANLFDDPTATGRPSIAPQGGHAIAGILDGIKPAIVAIVAAASWRIGTRTIRNGLLAAIAGAAFVAIALLAVPFPLVVLGAALAGAIGGRLRPGLFAGGGTQAAGAASREPALIDDDTPTPAHARFAWHRLALVVAGGLGLGLALWLPLVALSGAGTGGTLPQMAWFFTKTAVMGFGGAYAVLPYVVQNAVEHYHWLTASQMIDGLALGETTPGPLIMVVAFVGFLGGWTHAPGAALPAGALGALVATAFTFLPSFVFILAGGPLVESTRGNVRMTAPLSAISAAVVGVIASLAVFFGRQVFFAGGAPHWTAIAIGAAAAFALLRLRAGTIPTIAACALAGLVLSYWHG
jgi:chromate transporter